MPEEQKGLSELWDVHRRRCADLRREYKTGLEPEYVARRTALWTAFDIERKQLRSKHHVAG